MSYFNGDIEESGHIGYYVRPSMRGKGLGSVILQLGLKKAKLEKVLLT